LQELNALGKGDLKAGKGTARLTKHVQKMIEKLETRASEMSAKVKGAATLLLLSFKHFVFSFLKGASYLFRVYQA
jgi:hypothetical protein